MLLKSSSRLASGVSEKYHRDTLSGAPEHGTSLKILVEEERRKEQDTSLEVEPPEQHDVLAPKSPSKAEEDAKKKSAKEGKNQEQPKIVISVEKMREFDVEATKEGKEVFPNMEEPFRQILIKKNKERDEIDRKISEYQKRLKDKKLETPYSVEKLRQALLQNSRREISSVMNSYIQREKSVTHSERKAGHTVNHLESKRELVCKYTVLINSTFLCSRQEGPS